MKTDLIRDLVKRRLSELHDPQRPRLRFDKVALRFFSEVGQNLSESVPDDKTALLTITAPIRLPSKTAEELEYRIRTILASGSAKSELSAVLQGNYVRGRIVNSRIEMPRVVGFVHNPDAGAAEVLLDVMQSVLS